MKKFLVVFATLFMFSAISFAKYDDTYKSWQIEKKVGNTIYVRFRVNIPLVIKHFQKQIAFFEKKLKTEKSPRKQRSYKKTIGNYKVLLEQMKKHRKVKAVYVFGDFNGWKTAGSDKPNKLIPSKKNPDTWYARTYVPFLVAKKGDQLRYKFVIDLGYSYTAKDGTKQDYIYTEDPLNKNNSPDGFGGFNSYFTY